MIRRSHKDCRKSAARSSRIREKALRLQQQVKRSAIAVCERRQARLGWWRRAFSGPLPVVGWIFSEAKTLWAAFTALLGMHSESYARPSSSFKHRKSYRPYRRRALLMEGMEQRQLLAIDVAVVYDLANTGGYAATAAQLNDETYFDFNATVVPASSLTTIGALSNYDAVVIGGDGNNDSLQNTAFANALNTWVTTHGGGVVMTGFGLSGGTASSGFRSAVDSIIPVQTTAAWGFSGGNSSNPGPVGGSFTSMSHVVTDGVGPFSIGSSSAPTEWSQSTALSSELDAGASPLGTLSGRLVGAAAEKGTGRVIWLGPAYTANSSGWGTLTAQLQSGNADRLLEQAVAWAAASTTSVIDTTPPTIVGTNPSFATNGALAAGTTSLQVAFSKAVAFTNATAAIPLGSSASYPAQSAKQILLVNPAASSGVYWFDPDGAGPVAPFQAHADMTTDGGGWILAVNSVVGNEAPSNEVTANTGLPNLSVGHTRNVAALAQSQTAQIRHEIDANNVGQGSFHGKYTGLYQTMPSLGSFTLLGSSNTGLLANEYNKSLSGTPYGSPWYSGSGPFTTIPATPANGTGGPAIFNNPNQFINSYRIWVRETATPPTVPATLPGTSATGALDPYNYELRRAGVNGLLGEPMINDDVIVPLSVSYNTGTNTATLTFAALAEDVYRLTVKDTITDAVGNSLDGDSSGTAGGDWRKDLVVGPLTHTLTSPNGFVFDVEFGGFGAGQSVQGTNNSFDGMGRMTVDGVDYSPQANNRPTISVTEFTTATTSSVSTNYTTVPGLSSFTANSAGLFKLSGTVSVISNTFSNNAYGGTLRYGLFRNGALVEDRYNSTTNQFSARYSTFEVESYLTLAPGDFVELRVQNVNGTSMSFFGVGQNGSAALRIAMINELPNGTPSLSVTEFTTTTTSSVSTNYTTVPGLSSFTANSAGLFEVSGTVSVISNTFSNNAYGGTLRYGLFRNGVLVEDRYNSTTNQFSSARYSTFEVEDYLTLAPGDVVELRVANVNGTSLSFFGVGQNGSAALRVAKVNELANGTPSLSVTELITTNTNQVSTGYTTAPGLSSFTATSAGLFKLSGTVSVISNTIVNGAYGGTLRYGLFRNGTIVEERYNSTTNQFNTPFSTFEVEDCLTLAPGDVVELRVQNVHSTSMNFFYSGPNGSAALRVAKINEYSIPTLTDSNRTVLTYPQSLSELQVYRKVTVPSMDENDFARTVDVFTNPTANAITVPVRIVGNLGSDSATTVFSTSNGDNIVEASDQWIGTDDADGTGTPAIIHYIHGPSGVQPNSVEVIGDNIYWEYNLTVPAGETVRLTHFTILNTTRSGAIAAANALVTSSGFAGEAAAFLTSAELASLANFQFTETDVEVIGGDLVITDTNGGNTNDNLNLTLNGTNVRISDPNNQLWAGAGATQIDEHTVEVPFSSISAGNIQLNTLGGDDSLTLALAGGDFIPTGGVVYAGGGNNDSLTITGGSQGTVTYNYTNANDGSIVMANFGTVTYTGLAPITNSGSATDVIFNLPATGSVATLGDDGTSGNGMSRLSSSPSTFELTNFSNPTGSLTINRGHSTDTITVANIPDLSSSLTIGSGTSSFASAFVSGAVALAAGNTLSVFAGSILSAGPITTSGGAITFDATGDITVTKPILSDGGVQSLQADSDGDGVGTLALSFAITQFVDPNPAAGNQFGATVLPLTSGNVVVTSPGDDVGGTDAGAVYLFNGLTGALISTLRGSTANDQVGAFGVTALSNGNYVVRSNIWDNGAVLNAGAVTWGSGTVGVSGVVSAANSLVGSTASDLVGAFGVTALSNGNYVVRSPDWDNGAANDAGAVTWSSGTSGVSGVVSAANSVIGSTPNAGSGLSTIVAVNGDGLFARFPNDVGGRVFIGSQSLGFGALPGSLNAGSGSISLGAADATLQATIASSSTVLIAPHQNGRPIDLGTNAAGSLGLTDAELDLISAGTLQIGDVHSGTITVSGDVTRAASTNVQLVSGSDIVISSGQINTAGGTLLLDSGTSPATIKPTRAGTDVTASILSFGGDLGIVIDGTTADSQYTQLNFAGQVDLSGVNLVLSGSYAPADGDSFVIVNNDGSDAILGTFSGLAEGAILTVNGVNKRITYIGGDGNDVVLISAKAKVEFSTSTASDTESSGGNLPKLLVKGTLVTSQTIDVTIIGGSATAGTDFTNTTTVTIPAGTYDGTLTTAVDINLSINNDSVVEANETIQLALANPSAGLEIIDANSDSTTQDTHTYTILDDDTAELSINDVSLSEDGTFTFTITSDKVASQDMTLVVNTADGTATLADSDYTALTNVLATITAGSTSTTVTVTVSNDAVVENNETFFLNLSEAKFNGATDASRVVIGDAQGQATILNNDSATISIGDVNQNETDGETTFSFLVTLSNPVDTSVSATVNTADANATALYSGVGGDDYEAITGGTVSFAAGATSQTINVTVNGDNWEEGDEKFFVNLSSLMAGSRSVTFADSTGEGMILNDDVAPLANAGGPYEVNEGSSLTLNASASTDADLPVDTLTYRWDLDGDGNYDENVTGVSPTLTLTQLLALGLADGPHVRNVTVEVSDGTNMSTAQTTVTINNVAPQNVNAGADQTVNEGDTVNLSGSFTDPSSADTHTQTWSVVASNGQTIANGSGGTFSFVPNDNGTYTITYTVVDDDGGTASDEVLIAVDNDDPTATLTAPASETYGTALTVSLSDAFDPSAADTAAGFRYAFGLDSNALALATYVGSSVDSSENFLLDAGTYTIYARIIDKDDGFTQYQTEVTVTPAALTVIADGQNKVYGDDDPTLTFVTSGFQFGDQAADVLTGGLVRAAGENVGSYAIVQGSLTANANYTLSFTGANLAITPATLTFTADAQSKVYGAADPALSYSVSGLQFSDTEAAALSGLLARTAGENVGSYAVGQGSLVANANYSLSFTGANLAITPATLTVTADAQNKVYGAADPLLSYSVSGLQFSDTEAAVLTGLIARAAGEDVGSYAIGQGSLAANANYTLSFTGANLAITPATLTVTADAQSKVYGAADPLLSYSVSGLQFSDSEAAVLTGLLARAAGEDVGSYAIGQGSLEANANYTLSFTGANLAITPATLTVITDAQSKVYGAADPLLSYSVSGLQFSDTEAAVLTGLLARAAGENVGSYAIGQGSLTANANYTLSFTGANLAITPATLMVIADAQSKVYGAVDPTLSYSVSGLQFSDSEAAMLTGLLVRAVGENVGSYAIGQGSLVANANYSLSFTGANLAITPATLTVTADAQSKVYGVADPLLSYSVSGLQFSDTEAAVLTGLLARAAGEDVGSYAVGQGSLAANSNYTLSFTGANLAITPATLTVTADAQNKVYGAADPLLSYSVSGLQFSDTEATVLSGLLARAAGEDVGSYAIGQGSLAANANYTLSFTAANLAITPATLTVTASGVNKGYDGTTVAMVTLSDDRLAGDDLTLAYGTALFVDKNVGTDKPISVSAISLSGTAAGNYTFNTSAAAMADITARPASWTADNSGKIFGESDPNPLTTGSGSGFLPEDEVFAIYERELGEDVDDYDLIALLGSNVLSQTELNNNYAINNAGAIFTINQAGTSLGVNVSMSTPLYGVDGLTLTASVSVISGAGTPTGSVTFYDGTTILGTVTVNNGTATLQLAPTTLGVGPHTLRAVFNNQDGNFAGSEAEFTVTVLAPSSIQGMVYVDFNNNGEVDFGEGGVANAMITLTGINDLGQPVHIVAYTDADGVYSFVNLRPSNAAGYTLIQTQPAGLIDGLDMLGTIDGLAVGTASNDVFSGIVLADGKMGENYNFGERPATSGAVGSGQTAGIGFWQNKNGQNLIKSLNGGANSTQLGNWLAATFSEMYGSLAGQTNAQVASHYKSLFGLNGKTAPGGPPKTDAQVMATALAVYATNHSLAGSAAIAYGFQVTTYGVGGKTFNVGNRGAAFGVANNTSLSVMDLLLSVNVRSKNGLLYDLDGNGSIDSHERSLRTMANDVFSAINELGGK